MIRVAGDMRRSLSRFEEENFKHNMALVDAVKVIAVKKGVTPAQLAIAIAWVISRCPRALFPRSSTFGVDCITGIPEPRLKS